MMAASGEEEEGKFLLLYASVTGQAQAIAEEIAEKAPQHGLHADILCMSLTEKKFWLEREKLAVIISSTTGDGECPENAAKFWRRAKKKTLKSNHFSKLRFTMLGLGDSNYTQFCNCAKSMDRRLQELGAVHFYEPAWADDAVGLEVDVEPWMEGLFPALRKQLGLAETNQSDVTKPVMKKVEKSSDKDKDVSIIQNGVDKAVEKITNSDGTNPLVIKAEKSSDNDKDASIVQNGENKTDKADEPDLIVIENTDSKSNSQNPSEKLVNGNGDCMENSTDSATKEISTQIAQKTDGSKQNAQKMDGPAESNEKTGSPAETVQDSLIIRGLRQSSLALADVALTVPVCPAAFLSVEKTDQECQDFESIRFQNGCPPPSSGSAVSMATVTKAEQLTREDALKTTLLLELDICDCGWSYLPGDSIGILAPNSHAEVETLLHRLNLTSANTSDSTLNITLLPSGHRKKSVPAHIPTLATPRHVFTHCLDVRAPPSKALLRCLVEHTTEEGEKRRLQELCSRQGAEEYARNLREAYAGIVDVLRAFPSCRPPLHRIYEHLPRLQPRPYSVASSPLQNPGRLQIAFNVLEFEDGRSGVCTGWLQRITREMQSRSVGGGTEETPSVKIPVYLRKGSDNFRLPSDPSQPIIMIGPGTGVAPFVGFLQHRSKEMQLCEEKGETVPFGDMWLFFGCRHRDRDFIFREELEEFHRCGVLSHFYTAFSREPQYNIEINCDDLTEKIAEITIEETPKLDVKPRDPTSSNIDSNIKDSTDSMSPLTNSSSQNDLVQNNDLVQKRFYVQDLLRRKVIGKQVCEAVMGKRNSPTTDQKTNDSNKNEAIDTNEPMKQTNNQMTDTSDASGARTVQVSQCNVHPEENTDAISPLARVYVCGDAKGMAKDVQAAFVDLLSEHGGMERSEAEAYLLDMRLQKRYVEDVWT